MTKKREMAGQINIEQVWLAHGGDKDEGKITRPAN